jgi:hypothetical protein
MGMRKSIMPNGQHMKSVKFDNGVNQY